MIERAGAVRGVVEGSDGRLFLGDQEGFALRWFLSRRPFTTSLLEVWRRALRRRAREFKRRGIPYVFYLVPDAHFVYPEDLPADLNASDCVPPGTSFLESIGELRDLTIVDPRADLISAKGLLEIYRRVDTHWTQYGSFIGYKSLAKALAGLMPFSILNARDASFEYRRWFGDLGVRVEPERVETTPRVTLTRNDYSSVYENEGYKRTGCKETYSPGAEPGRLLMMRDSFVTDQYEYIGRSARYVLSAGTTTAMYFDEVDAWKPHVVVSQIGERRLYAFEWDHRRETFDDMFRSDFISPRGRRAQKALLFMDASRPLDALTEIEDFDRDPNLRHDHAYVAAQVYLAAGLLERAAAAIGVCLASYPARPSYVSLSAMIALARGEYREAAALAERAVALAPYNGFHHQTYAYVLMSSGENETVRNHLAHVLAEIDDYSVLWFLHSKACEAVGDVAGASDSIVQALILDSSDANFRNHARHLWRA